MHTSAEHLDAFLAHLRDGDQGQPLQEHLLAVSQASLKHSEKLGIERRAPRLG